MNMEDNTMNKKISFKKKSKEFDSIVKEALSLAMKEVKLLKEEEESEQQPANLNMNLFNKRLNDKEGQSIGQQIRNSIHSNNPNIRIAGGAAYACDQIIAYIYNVFKNKKASAGLEGLESGEKMATKNLGIIQNAFKLYNLRSGATATTNITDNIVKQMLANSETFNAKGQPLQKALSEIMSIEQQNKLKSIINNSVNNNLRNLYNKAVDEATKNKKWLRKYSRATLIQEYRLQLRGSLGSDIAKDIWSAKNTSNLKNLGYFYTTSEKLAISAGEDIAANTGTWLTEKVLAEKAMVDILNKVSSRMATGTVLSYAAKFGMRYCALLGAQAIPGLNIALDIFMALSLIYDLVIPTQDVDENEDPILKGLPMPGQPNSWLRLAYVAKKQQHEAKKYLDDIRLSVTNVDRYQAVMGYPFDFKVAMNQFVELAIGAQDHTFTEQNGSVLADCWMMIIVTLCDYRKAHPNYVFYNETSKGRMRSMGLSVD